MESLQAINLYLLLGALLVLAGIASSLLARRFGAPLLLIFLVLGMLLGEDGPGGVAFDNYRVTYLIGSLALALILFDGGIRTRLTQLRGTVLPSTLLATVGVVLTAALTALVAVPLLNLSWIEAMLLGAMVASTDAAAVFFLLRTGGLQLQRRSNATLELESGSNDPVAVFLTILLTGWLASETRVGPGGFALALLQQAGIGGMAGVAGGLLLAQAMNRLALPAGLHPWLAMGGAVLVFAFANLLGGSGFLAVYVAGVIIGNRKVRAIANVQAVQDAATWMAQMVMFLVLGLLVSPMRLLEVLWPALGVAAFLMFVARPASVWLCLLPFGYRKGEVAFIAWVGLRGAVGIFLASIPMLAGLPNAQLFFNVAFVVVLASLLVQGWSLAPAARMCKVSLPRKEGRTRRIELDLPGQLELEMVGYRVASDAAILGGAPLPGWARPAMIVRKGQIHLPHEGLQLQPGDYAYFLAPPGDVYRLDWLFADRSEAREAEQELFGAFTLPGNVPLGAVTSFYGIDVPAKYADYSAAHLFDQRFDGRPQIGDRLRLGPALLVARAVKDERVTQVGIKFVGVGSHVFGDEAASLTLPGLWQRLRRKLGWS
ncbi:MAG TPA: potassium/proton antiporter [Arenimonas sp.]|nr:potassium/proton antiporter [Arenimonas sp.]